jgi:hypothetical protein
MKKILLFSLLLFTCVVIYAGEAQWQYFIACDRVWAIDSRASTAEVLYWMDTIEAGCAVAETDLQELEENSLEEYGSILEYRS